MGIQNVKQKKVFSREGRKNKSSCHHFYFWLNLNILEGTKKNVGERGSVERGVNTKVGGVR